MKGRIQRIDAALLGGKTPEYYIQPRNLLDNSDFRNPVNQRGAKNVVPIELGSYNFIDRWSLYGSGSTFSVDTEGVHGVNDGSATCGMVQRLESNVIQAGKTYTLAFMGTVTGIWYLSYGITGSAVTKSRRVWATGIENVHVFSFVAEASTEGVFNFQIRSNAEAATIDVKWAALYECEYTSETLPPYVPKGYAAEQHECQRYYYYLANYTALHGYKSNVAYAFLVLPAKMRTTPTVTAEEVAVRGSLEGEGAQSMATIKSVSDSFGNYLRITLDGDNKTNNQVIITITRKLEVSADL